MAGADADSCFIFLLISGGNAPDTGALFNEECRMKNEERLITLFSLWLLKYKNVTFILHSSFYILHFIMVLLFLKSVHDYGMCGESDGHLLLGLHGLDLWTYRMLVVIVFIIEVALDGGDLRL